MSPYLQHVHDLMDEIMSDEVKSNWERLGISFIFSDTWGTDPELLRRYGSIVKGSFTFNIDTDFNVSCLKQIP